MSEFKISIPTDNEGFVLLQCSFCGEYFKLLGSDVNREDTLNIWCPYCGLNGRNFAPEEAEYNVIKVAKNEINELIYNMFKDIERENRNNKNITFKCGKSPEKEIVSPIKVRVDNLEIKQFKCCGTVAKIKPLSIGCGSYCPRCGGIDYE